MPNKTFIVKKQGTSYDFGRYTEIALVGEGVTDYNPKTTFSDEQFALILNTLQEEKDCFSPKRFTFNPWNFTPEQRNQLLLVLKEECDLRGVCLNFFDEEKGKPFTLEEKKEVIKTFLLGLPQLISFQIFPELPYNYEDKDGIERDHKQFYIELASALQENTNLRSFVLGKINLTGGLPYDGYIPLLQIIVSNDRQNRKQQEDYFTLLNESKNSSIEEYCNARFTSYLMRLRQEDKMFTQQVNQEEYLLKNILAYLLFKKVPIAVEEHSIFQITLYQAYGLKPGEKNPTEEYYLLGKTMLAIIADRLAQNIKPDHSFHTDADANRRLKELLNKLTMKLPNEISNASVLQLKETIATLSNLSSKELAITGNTAKVIDEAIKFLTSDNMVNALHLNNFLLGVK